jgi:hypothetical protein
LSRKMNLFIFLTVDLASQSNQNQLLQGCFVIHVHWKHLLWFSSIAMGLFFKYYVSFLGIWSRDEKGSWSVHSSLSTDALWKHCV